jgi:hypothetical protein
MQELIHLLGDHLNLLLCLPSPPKNGKSRSRANGNREESIRRGDYINKGGEKQERPGRGDRLPERLTAHHPFKNRRAGVKSILQGGSFPPAHETNELFDIYFRAFYTGEIKIKLWVTEDLSPPSCIAMGRVRFGGFFGTSV